MADPKATASYKKQVGTVAVSNGKKALLWTPSTSSDGQPTFSIAVSTITNLQQTPASSPKVALKVFSQAPGAPAPEAHTFSFTSTTAARAEADAIKDALGALIQQEKIAPGPAAGAQSATLAMAKAVSAGASASASTTAAGGAAGGDASDWYDDARLQADIELQQSLLRAHLPLQKTFMEALRTKPDAISNAAFAAHFWSTRLPLLRAHAIERRQARGAYNVLAALRATTQDNVTRLSISKEQIQLIFRQHPLAKRAYDECVPRLREADFWARFFQSRLFRKLKGERISDADAFDAVIDAYLQYDDNDMDDNDNNGDNNKDNASGVPSSRRGRLAESIPHIIDVEGNEENHSQRRGNRPDLTMRPSAMDKTPIIRTLNTLSERIMAEVAPVDAPLTASSHVEDDVFKQLALHDLEADAEEHRVILAVKDQQRFFAADKPKDEPAAPTAQDALQDPSAALKAVAADLQQSLGSAGGMDLEANLGVDEASDSDGDGEDGNCNDSSGAHRQRRAHIGSRSSLADATRHVLAAVTQRRLQADDPSSSSAPSITSSLVNGVSNTSPPNGDGNGNGNGNAAAAAAAAPDQQQRAPFNLSATLYERLRLTNTTTLEFLHHFWAALLSGDAARAREVAGLAASLERAQARMAAVAADADAERARELERRKHEIREVYRTSGRRLKLRADAALPGGADVVRALFAATLGAVQFAAAKYEAALREGGQ